MDLGFATQDIFSGKSDAIVLFTYEGSSEWERRWKEKISDNVSEARRRQDFLGEHNETFLEIRSGTPRFCLLVGLGKKDALTPAHVREAAATAARELQDKRARTISFQVPEELDAHEMGQAISEGAILGTYRFSRYKTRETLHELKGITITSDRTGLAVKRGAETGRMIAESVNLVRDLQNMSPSELTPAAFADEVGRVAKKERLKAKVLDKKQLEKQGFGGILAVGGGSENEPRLVTIEYVPKNAKKTICVVGKGITFDTGGLSMKPSEHMLGMKFDMSGAAAVLGIVVAASRLQLPMRVVGVLGLAENAVDGKSYRPDDIVKTKSGLTIEVQNTDAEGRIVLADALFHAAEMEPDALIDIATLTGAAVIALGDVAAPLLGNDQRVVDALLDASRKSGELAWQMPLWDEYEKDIQSKVADMKNMPVKRMAGTIVAAMLLKQFVKGVSWAHIDIAGVADADPRECYFTRDGEGGTGFGVRLVVQYLRDL